MVLPYLLFLLFTLVLCFCFHLSESSDMDGEHPDEKTIQAIIDLHKTGLNSKEIYIQKGLKLHTVQELIQKFKAGGSKNLPLP